MTELPKEPEDWEYVVCGYRGSALYRARTIEEALDGIAKDRARSATKPKRTILRRRKAGAWAPVELTPCTNCDGFEDTPSPRCTCWCHPTPDEPSGARVAAALEAYWGVRGGFSRSQFKAMRAALRAAAEFGGTVDG